MGEQKRKHVAEVIAKAVLCGAVFHKLTRMQLGQSDIQFTWFADLPEEGTFVNNLGVRVYRANGGTEYQCAVSYLTHLGVPYETLVYGSKGFGIRATTRLRQRARKRSGVSRQPKSARFKPR